jgi:hypothetical protein
MDVGNSGTNDKRPGGPVRLPKRPSDLSGPQPRSWFQRTPLSGGSAIP